MSARTHLPIDAQVTTEAAGTQEPCQPEASLSEAKWKANLDRLFALMRARTLPDATPDELAYVEAEVREECPGYAGATLKEAIADAIDDCIDLRAIRESDERIARGEAKPIPWEQVRDELDRLEAEGALPD